jgi:hypothetical protein
VVVRQVPEVAVAILVDHLQILLTHIQAAEVRSIQVPTRTTRQVQMEMVALVWS